MRIRLSDAALMEALIEAFAAADCRCERVAADVCEVFHPAARDESEARTELVFFVRAWEQQRPGVRATLA
jgi:hypothetical protein